MDSQMIQQLYEAYGKELFLYLYSLCRNRELSQDLLQETYVKAITAAAAWQYAGVAVPDCQKPLPEYHETGKPEGFPEKSGRACLGRYCFGAVYSKGTIPGAVPCTVAAVLFKTRGIAAAVFQRAAFKGNCRDFAGFAGKCKGVKPQGKAGASGIYGGGRLWDIVNCWIYTKTAV